MWRPRAGAAPGARPPRRCRPEGPAGRGGAALPCPDPTRPSWRRSRGLGPSGVSCPTRASCFGAMEVPTAAHAAWLAGGASLPLGPAEGGTCGRWVQVWAPQRRGWSESRAGRNEMRGLGHLLREERLRELRLFGLEKGGLGGSHHCTNSLKEGEGKEGATFFSVVPGDRPHGNGHTSKYREYHLNIRKKKNILLPGGWSHSGMGCSEDGEVSILGGSRNLAGYVHGSLL